MVQAFVKLNTDPRFRMGATATPEAGYWKWLDENGEQYSEVDLKRSKAIAKQYACKAKECYYNAQMIASMEPDLTYVEGQATGMIPTGHGWLVDRAGKVIDPMAPSVNSKRLTDAKKINKWLLRNCKWTFGRECTAQEKGNVLLWLSEQ